MKKKEFSIRYLTITGLPIMRYVAQIALLRSIRMNTCILIAPIAQEFIASTLRFHMFQCQKGLRQIQLTSLCMEHVIDAIK